MRVVSACRLTGLAGARVADRTAPLLKRQPDAPIAWDGTLFERLFDRAAPLQLAEGARRLCLSMTGFDEWMVWN
ncbi:MAG: D-hexose-6-phosphate mutarotase, partial [Betaproteobacteria bacterium]